MGLVSNNKITERVPNHSSAAPTHSLHEASSPAKFLGWMLWEFEALVSVLFLHIPILVHYNFLLQAHGKWAHLFAANPGSKRVPLKFGAGGCFQPAVHIGLNDRGQPTSSLAPRNRSIPPPPPIDSHGPNTSNRLFGGVVAMMKPRAISSFLGSAAR